MERKKTSSKNSTVTQAATRMRPALLAILTLVTLIIILTSQAIAQTNEREQYTEMIQNAPESSFRITSKGGFSLIEESVVAKTSLVEVDIVHIAEDEPGQSVRPAKFKGDFQEQSGNTLRWLKPEAGKHQFESTQELDTKRAEQTRITKKIPFPFRSQSDEDRAILAKYTKPSEKIDSDNRIIREKASELAEGIDDQYIIAAKIAEWVSTNIEYDLSTLTESVTQPASWVLGQRVGVCDEISTLYIAMMRSLGIPARFVVGLSYSDTTDSNNMWGAHGWAEVYFPEAGWVPFDPTYKQYGWIDASHIKLGDTVDPEEFSVKFRWSGHDTNLLTEQVEFHVEPLSIASPETRAERKTRQTALSVDTAQSQVGFDSYNQISVKVTNPTQSYESVKVFLQPITGLETEPDEGQVVHLAPGETQTRYWLMHVGPELERELLYTVPVHAIADTGDDAQTTFMIRSGAPIFEKSAFAQYSTEQASLDRSRTSAESLSNLKASMSCQAKEEVVYKGDSVQIECLIKNDGNEIIRNGQLCFEEKCETQTILIGEEKRVTLSFTPKKEGERRGGIVFLAQSQNVQEGQTNQRNSQITTKSQELARSLVLFAYGERPKPEIVVSTFPEEIGLSEKAEIIFSVRKATELVPEDVTIQISHGHHEKVWTVDRLTGEQVFTITVFGNTLIKGDNPIIIKATLKDTEGNTIEEQQTRSITLKRLSGLDHIEYYWHRLNDKVTNIFKQA